MESKSKNPSSMRSRKLITESLIKLMMIKPYSEITITEIANNAEVVRRTFYRNYKSKEEVIEYYLLNLVKGLAIEFIKIEDVNPYNISIVYFNYMSKYSSFFQILDENNLFTLLLDVGENFIPKLNKTSKKDLGDEFDEQFLDYYHAFNVSGMWFVLMRWIRKGMVESPEELALIYDKILKVNLYNKSK